MKLGGTEHKSEQYSKNYHQIIACSKHSSIVSICVSYTAVNNLLSKRKGVTLEWYGYIQTKTVNTDSQFWTFDRCRTVEHWRHRDVMKTININDRAL